MSYMYSVVCEQADIVALPEVCEPLPRPVLTDSTHSPSFHHFHRCVASLREQTEYQQFIYDLLDYATHSEHDSVYARCDCAIKN